MPQIRKVPMLATLSLAILSGHLRRFAAAQVEDAASGDDHEEFVAARSRRSGIWS